MTSYVIGVTYNGHGYCGWQRQNDQLTVQGDIERALQKIADTAVRLSVAGRTDTGVHATGQIATFTTQAPRSLHEWRRGLNGLTPTAIHIDWVQPSPAEFHPRYSATSRRYTYVYHDVGYVHPHLLGQVWGCTSLDADAMHRAAQELVGEHDFSSFRGSGCQSITPLRRVNFAHVRRQGEFVVFEIEANAFLLHMVRNIARALHDAGAGLNDHGITDLLTSQDRTLVGATAPPDGLYLTYVSYPGHGLPTGRRISFLSSN